LQRRDDGAVLIDANLFVLLTVGTYDTREIARHRRLRSKYDLAAFDRLFAFIAQFDKIIATPGLLTEVSNLLSDRDDPVSVGVKRAFAVLVKQAAEVYHPSCEIVDLPEFAWLGLTDAAQIRAAESLGCILLSDDGPLCDAALRRAVEAVHFSSL